MAKIGVVFYLMNVFTDGVFYIVDINKLDVKLIVKMFNLFKQIMVCFSCRSLVKLVFKAVKLFPVIAEICTPLITLGEKFLWFCCGDHVLSF